MRDEATIFLRRKIRSNRLAMMTILVPCFFVTFYALFFITHQIGLGFILLLTLPGMFALLILSDLSYKISYSSRDISMYKAGVGNLLRSTPSECILLSNIDYISDTFAGDEAIKSRFMPFDLIVIDGKNSDNVPILVYIDSFKKSSVVDFLIFLRKLKPELMSPRLLSVIEFQ